jgi:hypothetical protein
MNLNRRHLTTAQRSMIAADLAKMQRGRPSKGSEKNPQNCGLSTKAAAEQLKVSPRSVETGVVIDGNRRMIVVELLIQFLAWRGGRNL